VSPRATGGQNDLETFRGFPDDTFRFLAELTMNNEKAWFEANRRRYEEFYLTPALAFIGALGPRLTSTLPGEVRYEARVNGSLFRINRDVRFSKDKTPYKNHIDMWFWQGERKGWETPGYFMRLLPDRFAIGGGMHHFDKRALDAYRGAVLDEDSGTGLQKIIEQVRAAGSYEVGGWSRRGLPRGVANDHPRAELLRHEGLAAVMETPVPREAASPDFVDYCLSHFKNVSPVNQWLTRAMESSSKLESLRGPP
jgi:uncharacterized protein (TIGR02453 family)